MLGVSVRTAGLGAGTASAVAARVDVAGSDYAAWVAVTPSVRQVRV